MNAPLLTIAETAQRLRISKSKLYSIVATGKIGHYKVGGSIRFSEEHVREFLESVERQAEDDPPNRIRRHLPRLKNFSLD